MKEYIFRQDIIELTNRLRRLPEVEAKPSISNNARPYIGSNSGSMLRNNDTLVSNPLRRSVTLTFSCLSSLSKC